MELKKKEFKFKGMLMEELQKFNVREFAKLLPSRKKRTILRNFQEHEEFITLAKSKNDKKKQIRTHKRSLIIVPELVGLRIQIYNGNKFVPVDIVGEMLGHSFGEFSLTRARIKHEKKGGKAKAKK